MDTTFAEIFERLNSFDESVQIEAKTASEVGKSIRETVSAFANEPDGGGGYFLLGVAKDAYSLFPNLSPYTVVGVEDPDKLQSDLASLCASDMNVSVRPDIVVEKFADKNVILVHIPEASDADKPIYIKSKGLPKGAFRRIGSTDQHCTDENIAFFHQLHTHRAYDETIIEGSTIDDIDTEALQEYRRLRQEERPEAETLKYNDVDLLYALHAITKQDGVVRVTIAGLILFGKAMSIRRYMPSVRVDYIRVPGRTWVEDPDRRYETIDRLGPLALMTPVSFQMC